MGEKKTDIKVEFNDSKTAHAQEVDSEQDLAGQRLGFGGLVVGRYMPSPFSGYLI
jgi:hypothetical protein